VGNGVSSVAAPTYVSEISTPATQRRLVALYQFNIVFGILVAFLSNCFLEGVGGENDWRYMLGIMTIPSVLYSLLVLGVPESPRWLLARKGHVEEAETVLTNLDVQDVKSEIAAIRKVTGTKGGLVRAAACLAANIAG
jgi:MFS family permease